MARLRSKRKFALPDHILSEKRLREVRPGDLACHRRQAKSITSLRSVKNVHAGQFEFLFSFAFEGGFFL